MPSRAAAARGHGGIVGDEDEGGTALAVQVEHEADDRVAGRGIEAARGFVREQQRRFRHEGTRQGDPLLLAAGQVLGVVAQAAAQAHAAEHRLGLRARVRIVPQFQRQHHVFQRVQVGEQLKRLEHEAQPGLAECGAAVLVEGEDVGPVEQHLAGRRRIEARQQAEQGGLAGTGRADQGKRLGRLHGKIHLVQDRELAARVGDALAQAADFDRGLAVPALSCTSI
jgi:hypothetical protein